MTRLEKRRILALRDQKKSYKEIATELDMSINTIKTFFFRRKNEEVKEENTQGPTCCKQCGTPIEQPEHRKEKKFCSDHCRFIWWNAHRDLAERASAHELTCKICGKKFYSYHGQYCSRACSGKARTLKAAQHM